MELSKGRNIRRRDFVINSTAAVTALSACGFPAAYAKEKAKESWKMELATSSVMFDKLPIEQVCERAERLGLQGLDIWAPFSWGGAQCTHLEDIKKRLGGRGLRDLIGPAPIRVSRIYDLLEQTFAILGTDS